MGEKEIEKPKREQIRKELEPYSPKYEPSEHPAVARKLTGAEREFLLAGKGEMPKLIIANEKDAAKHIKKFESEYDRLLGPKASKGKTGEADVASIAKSNSKTQREILDNWLTKDYLGEKLYSLMGKIPPYLSTVPKSFFDNLEKATRTTYDVLGVAVNGSNHVMVSSEIGEGILSASAIAHEDLHYAIRLGGGKNVRWRDDMGKPVMKKFSDAQWLVEGLVSLHSEELAKENGKYTGNIKYPVETLVASFIQQIAGEDVTRNAMLTGDYTQVRNAVNAQLGAGSFEDIMQYQRGMEALNYMQDKFKENGIDYTKMMQDQITRDANARMMAGGA